MVPIIKNVCRAISVSGWNWSLFRNPLLTIICGHCQRTFKTRDYGVDKRTREIAVCCEHCGYWNKTGLKEIPDDDDESDE